MRWLLNPFALPPGQSMSVRTWGRHGRVCAGGLVLGLPLLVAADPLLDFALIDVSPSTQRVQSAPVVSWLIQSDAERFCATVPAKDGHAQRPEGCVYWQLNPARCTIVTTASTTHSQLGHLFLHCLKAK